MIFKLAFMMPHDGAFIKKKTDKIVKYGLY